MMSEHAELQKEIVSLLLENLNVEVSHVDEDLIETGLLDSLKIVELLMEIEQRFRLKIPLNDLEIDSFRSVRRIADFVKNHSGGRAMPNVVTLAASNPAT